MYESTHKLFDCTSIITDTSRAPNAQSCTVCHCIIFTLITIVIHQNVMQLRAVVCISYAHTAVLSRRSVCISLSVMRNSLVLRNTEHPTTRIEVVLLFSPLMSKDQENFSFSVHDPFKPQTLCNKVILFIFLK